MDGTERGGTASAPLSTAYVRQRIAAFSLAFARRQAAAVAEVPGGAAVRDPEFPASHEHNQLVLTEVPSLGELPAQADAALAGLSHRHITVLDDAAGAACAPVLTAAGYTHATELVMQYAGPAHPAPDPPAEPVTPADLRPAMLRRLRTWMPGAPASAVEQLADRRSARLRGADTVLFLAARAEDGGVASWADLYMDRYGDLAQIEDLVTADTHLRRGHASTVLTTALHRARNHALVFLRADPHDWPRTWYTRRGFVPVDRVHVFTRLTAG